MLGGGEDLDDLLADPSATNREVLVALGIRNGGTVSAVRAELEAG